MRGGAAPHPLRSFPCMGAPPLHPGGLCGTVVPAPTRRALRPSTPGDFPVAGKVTKGAPRAAPFGIPRGGPSEKCFTFRSRSPCSTLCCYPLKRVSAADPDRFATLSERANWSCFLPTPYKGHTCSCQSVARQVRCFRGCLGAEGGSALLGVAEAASLGRSKRNPGRGSFLKKATFCGAVPPLRDWASRKQRQSPARWPLRS